MCKQSIKYHNLKTIVRINKICKTHFLFLELFYCFQVLKFLRHAHPKRQKPLNGQLVKWNLDPVTRLNLSHTHLTRLGHGHTRMGHGHTLSPI